MSPRGHGSKDANDESDDAPPGKVSLDKWLWAARFFKTRTLAAEAIDGGKVEVNGERAKRARLLRPYVPLRMGGDSPSMRVRGLPG